MKRYLKVGFTLTGRDDLEQALSLFGAQFNENIEKNVEIARKAGFDSVFSSLPDVFTQSDVRVSFVNALQVFQIKKIISIFTNYYQNMKAF